MSSALSPRRDSSKLRWPKSKLPLPSEVKPSQSEKSSSTKLSLNLFFGLKSKKPASPVSRDPPTPLESPAPIGDRSTLPYSKRPPSKSVSSTRSRGDSIGPKTPSDGVRESRQSLLTLSDLDPFAGRGITVVTSPQSAIGPNRLSIYSNNSLPDVGKPEGKVYLNSPTSPSSRPLSPESIPFSSAASSRIDSSSPGRSALKKRSVDLSKRPGLDPSFRATAEMLPKLGSAATLTDRDDFSSVYPPRVTRARGMTDSAMSFSNYRISAASFTPARALSRRPSISRLGSPPSAPPTHGLPPPPVSTRPSHGDARGDDDDDDNTLPMEPISSSSCLSFASISSDAFLTYSPRKKQKALDASMKGSQKSPSIRGPKKSISHNSLAKSEVSPISLESQIEEDRAKDQEEKVLRKQRSFINHPRLPSLPMLSRSANTLPMPSSPSGSGSPIIEQRRGSNSSLPSRRRLFSGSGRRPSTSQGITLEDDAQSVFSLRSEQNVPSSTSPSWVRGASCSPSPGDEGENEEPGSPLLASKYTPQRIMTPAEMAQVEASLDVVSSPRHRGLSVSTITSWREQEVESTIPAIPPVPSPFTSTFTVPSRSSSLMYKSESSLPQLSARRMKPQVNLSPRTNEPPIFRPSSSPPLSLMSLPPPPRPRQRTTTAPSSIKSAHILSRPDVDLRSSLQPPPRKSLPAKTSAEHLLRRRSLLRKSSFLEIDDDGTQDADAYDKVDHHSASPGDSFLDLTRESFDANGD